MIANPQAERCAELFKALADSHRLRIIQCLRDGEKHVTDIAALLKVPIVNISHHLGVLKAGGLVQDKKQGRFVRYSLHPSIFVSMTPECALLDLGYCKLELPLANEVVKRPTSPAPA